MSENTNQLNSAALSLARPEKILPNNISSRDFASKSASEASASTTRPGMLYLPPQSPNEQNGWREAYKHYQCVAWLTQKSTYERNDPYGFTSGANSRSTSPVPKPVQTSKELDS